MHKGSVIRLATMCSKYPGLSVRVFLDQTVEFMDEIPKMNGYHQVFEKLNRTKVRGKEDLAHLYILHCIWKAIPSSLVSFLCFQLCYWLSGYSGLETQTDMDVWACVCIPYWSYVSGIFIYTLQFRKITNTTWPPLLFAFIIATLADIKCYWVLSSWL